MRAIHKERIRKVANAIAAAARTKKGLHGDIGFNMAAFVVDGAHDKVDSCGTTACIAGWAVAIKNDLGAAGLFQKYWTIPDIAAKWLGLDDWKAHVLFCCFPEEPSPSHAVAVLRHLAKTGEVDWSIKA